MIKIFIFFSTIFYSTCIFGYDIKGSWESDYCKSYNDSISYGRFIYEFKKDNKIQTFIQFYSGSNCKVKTYRQKQTKGNFYLNKIGRKKFFVTINYDHMNTPYSFKVDFVSKNKFKKYHGNHYHIYTKKN